MDVVMQKDRPDCRDCGCQLTTKNVTVVSRESGRCRDCQRLYFRAYLAERAVEGTLVGTREHRNAYLCDDTTTCGAAMVAMFHKVLGTSKPTRLALANAGVHDHARNPVPRALPHGAQPLPSGAQLRHPRTRARPRRDHRPQQQSADPQGRTRVPATGH